MTDKDIKLIIPVEHFFKAADTLNGNALKLWAYIMSNKDGYTFGLSPTDVYNKIGLDKKGYARAKKELQNKGYMVKILSGDFIVQSQQAIKSEAAEDSCPDQLEVQNPDGGQNVPTEELDMEVIASSVAVDKMPLTVEDKMPPNKGQNVSVDGDKMPREIKKYIEHKEHNKECFVSSLPEVLSVFGEKERVYNDVEKRQESFLLWCPPPMPTEEGDVICAEEDENGNIIYYGPEGVLVPDYDEDELPF